MQEENSVEEAAGQEIVFECPFCGKSYSIDARAAGMLFTCPACSKTMQIPPAPGTESDAGAPEAVPLEKVKHLIESYDELNARRENLERLRADLVSRFERISREVGVMQAALVRIEKILHERPPENEED